MADPLLKSESAWELLLDLVNAGYDDERVLTSVKGLFPGHGLWNALMKCLERGNVSVEFSNRFEEALNLERVQTWIGKQLTSPPNDQDFHRTWQTIAWTQAAIGMVRAAETVSGVTAPAGTDQNASLSNWKDHCIRALTPGSSLSALVAVPIVFVNREMSGSGMVAQLELELVAGAHETHQHPGYALSNKGYSFYMRAPEAMADELKARSEFHNSMARAFETAYAVSYLQPDSISRSEGYRDNDFPDCHGRWRVVDQDGRPIPWSMDGRSIEVAAFYGWYSALARRKYDPRVIASAMLAEVDPFLVALVKKAATFQADNCVERTVVRFGEVDGISAKVRAVAEETQGVIDTVAVSTANETEALDALPSNKKDQIRVDALRNIAIRVSV